MGREGARYSPEDKMRYVEMILSGRSPRSIEREFGISHHQTHQWVERYQEQGPDGLGRRRKNRIYSLELKKQVVQEYLSDETSLLKLCRKHDISNASVVYQWVSQYTSGKRIRATRRRNPMKDGRKATYLERIEIVQWTIENGFDYNRAVEQFKVSYAQVYNWVKKFQTGGEEALQDRRGRHKEEHELSEQERLELENKRGHAWSTWKRRTPC